MKVKIRKGDTVEIISGRFEDKGKRGEVINVFVEERRVAVQGVNIRTKHQRQVQTQTGRNISPGHVMLVCPKCDKAVRVGIQRDENGAHRVCKNCQAMID
jgi:large subunit ribosomal protein L24